MKWWKTTKFYETQLFNPVQDRDAEVGEQKGSPTNFSPVTSKNVGLSPQNFLSFSFNPFVTLMQNFKFIPSVSPKLLNLNQDHPSKKVFLWSSPYKIVLISTISLESHDKILLVTSWRLSRNIFILRRPGAANFADIIKILTMFIKKTC